MGADAASLAESIVQNIASGFLPCCFEDRIVGAKCPAVVALKTGPAGQTSEGFFSGKLFRESPPAHPPRKGISRAREAFPWEPPVQSNEGSASRKRLVLATPEREEGEPLRGKIHGQCGPAGTSNGMADCSTSRTGIACRESATGASHKSIAINTESPHE